MAGTELTSATVLTERLKKMTADEAVQMVRELCVQLDGTDFHGCIWPGNIRFDEDGKAVLGEGSAASAANREAEQVEFLAPEFFWEDDGSAAADVYSLGLLIYVICNGGYMPFQPKGGALTEKDRAAALRKRMKGERIPSLPGVSPELGAVVRRALAYEPERRYISAAELLTALGETVEALPGADEAASGPAVVGAAAEKTKKAAPKKGSSRAGKNGAKEDAPAREPEKDSAKEDAPAGEPEKDSAKEDAPAGEPEKAGAKEDAPAGEPEKDSAKEDAPAKEPEKAGAKENASAGEPEKAGAKKTASAKEQGKGSAKKTAPAKGSGKGGAKKSMAAGEPERDSAGKSLSRDAAGKGSGEKISRDGLDEKEPFRGEGSRERGARADASERKYTVRKDFEKETRPRRTASSAPASRRKRKKKTSPLILILSIVAIAILVIVAGRILFTDSQSDFVLSEPYTGGDPTPSASPASETGEDGEETAGDSSANGEALSLTVVRDTVYAIDSGVSLRVGPGTSYSVAQTLSRGTELQRTGVIGGWSQVQYEGTEYYVSSALVSVDDPLAGQESEEEAEEENDTSLEGLDITEKQDTVSIASDANLRSGPGTDYSVIAEVKTGAVLQRTGEVNGWSRVVYNGEDVFVSNGLIKTADSGDTGETEESAAAETAETGAAESAGLGTITITRQVNIRSGPGVDFSILGVAKVGETYTVTGFTSPKWYRVSYNGQMGFINKNYVDDSGANVGDDATATIQIDSAVNLRSGPGTGYSVIGTAKAGETFTAVSITDDHWYKIEYNGSTAYVSGKFASQVE